MPFHLVKGVPEFWKSELATLTDIALRHISLQLWAVLTIPNQDGTVLLSTALVCFFYIKKLSKELMVLNFSEFG